jgi:hypothetical protein
MGEEYVDHPLWARFLRWCTIRPKHYDTDNTNLTLVPHDGSSRLEELPDYEYTPLPDPKRDVRLVELLPGKFDDDVRIRIHLASITPPPKGPGWREELAEVRNYLPPGWEAFATVGELSVIHKIVD